MPVFTAFSKTTEQSTKLEELKLEENVNIKEKVDVDPGFGNILLTDSFEPHQEKSDPIKRSHGGGVHGGSGVDAGGGCIQSSIWLVVLTPGSRVLAGFPRTSSPASANFGQLDKLTELILHFSQSVRLHKLTTYPHFQSF